MRSLREDIQALYSAAERSEDLGALLEGVLAVFSRHPEELAEITGAFRLMDTANARSWGFRLTRGTYAALADTEAADVCVLGKPENLLRVFKREISPVKALLTGKVRVSGNKGLLLKLGEFL